MKKSVITYNHNLATFCLEGGSFDSLALYYTLKVTYSNSVAYSFSPNRLLSNLKKKRAISQNFSLDRFKKALDFLLDNGLAVVKNNHLSVMRVKQNRGFYKSKIKYNKININFNIIQRLLVKEGLLYSKFTQEKAMSFRSKMATDNIKALKQLRFTRSRKNKSKLELLGESYSTKVTFTYRKFAEKYGISLKGMFEYISWIKTNNELVIKKVVECNYNVICDYKTIIDVIGLKCYSYCTKEGNIISVLGSSIELVSTKR